jgi:hypothetical protein
MICKCKSCELSQRIQICLKKIEDNFLRNEVWDVIDDLWAEVEDTSTELGSIHAKITGCWPTDHTGGKHLVRVGKEWYEIHATKVENDTKEENRG